MSSAISELYYGRPIDPHYQASRSHHFYDQHGSRPLLPDVQFRVPMENRRDVDRVKDALDMEGVHGVNCDLATQTVTVSGNVPYHRLLKKLKHVKRKAKLLSFVSSDHPFSPSYGHESYDRPYSSSYGSSSYGRMPSRRPLSPPHLRSSSYVAHPHLERPYYEDYEDYRPYRFGGY